MYLNKLENQSENPLKKSSSIEKINLKKIITPKKSNYFKFIFQFIFVCSTVKVFIALDPYQTLQLFIKKHYSTEKYTVN